MGSDLCPHWVGSGFQRLKLSRGDTVIWGLGSPVNAGEGHQMSGGRDEGSRHPVLLVGWLVGPVQLRHLGALPGHSVVLWVARRAKMSSFVSF